MFRSYLKIAVRHLRKDSFFIAINILGLAVGLACFLLILRYVQEELSYDKHHSKADRIYRVTEEIDIEGSGEHSASCPFALAKTIENQYDEDVEYAVRLFNFQVPGIAVGYQDRIFYEKQLFFADPEIFEVFDFQWLSPDASHAFKKPLTAIISQSAAKRYFGKENPLGKELNYEGKYRIKVVGVVKDWPENSHFHFNILVSFSSLEQIPIGFITSGWYWNPCWTYLLLKPGADPQKLEAKLAQIVNRYFDKALQDNATLHLQALTDIRLHSQLDYEIAPNNDINFVYTMAVIGFLILLISAINFSNLLVAQIPKRLREVAIRKISGAGKWQIIQQFFAEAFVQALIAIVLCFMLIEIFLPGYNHYTDKSFDLINFLNPQIVSLLVVLIIGISFVAAAYPAFYLASHQPIQLLKRVFRFRKSDVRYRRLLVIMQFFITTFFTISFITLNAQVNFLLNSNLGFNREAVMVVPVSRSNIPVNYQNVRQQFMKHPSIIAVSGCEDIPGVAFQTGTFWVEGYEGFQQFDRLFVTPGFLKVMDINLIAGAPPDTHKSPKGATVVNRALTEHLGMKSPQEAVGKRMKGSGVIVGVTDNLHFMPLQTDVSPFVLTYTDNFPTRVFFMKYLLVRFDINDKEAVIAHMEKSWESYEKHMPFEFFYLDDRLKALYESDKQLSRVIGILTILAIVVCSLGLVAFTAYVIQKRTKEIGIRKAMGASAGNIVWLLSSSFLRLVLYGYLLALPLSYLALEWWLSSYAYHVEQLWYNYLLAGLPIISLVLLTIISQVYQAARRNPVYTLKYE